MNAMIIPVIVSAAWGIGCLTGVYLERRKFKRKIEVYEEKCKILLEEYKSKCSDIVTEKFYKNLEKRGITFERTLMLSVKECGNCMNKGKCSIYDNYNIDFCSDWRATNE